jgi:hypothetical protein
MNTKIMMLLAVMISFSVKTYATEKTEVVFISALHGAHKNHPSYDYDTLYKLVDAYNPDFVGVEIRPEDINAETSYLQSNYPHEMIELNQQYKHKVFGFDWLGDTIEGVEIPGDYWKNLQVKKLMNAMGNDDAFLAREPKELDELKTMQAKIVEQATPYSLNNGDYGKLCRQIDKLEEVWFSGTPYTEIISFNQKRDEKIASNIVTFIKQHRGSRIVLVMGADHRTFAVENIQKQLAENIIILPVNAPTI